MFAPLAFALETISESTIVVRDVKRLAVKEQQDALYAKVGEYSQVRRDGTFDGGLGIEQNILSTLMDGGYEVHVYEAPCGKGWRIIEYVAMMEEVVDPNTKLITYEPYEDQRIYTSGCESIARTVNW